MLWPIARTFGTPFDTLRGLQREMNRLFENAGTSGEPYPAVNIWGDENELILTAEIPGVDLKDMNINVVNDQLTIDGERKSPDAGDDVTWHRRERGGGRFMRSFKLPFEVDSDKVSAKYKDGVLKVMLPKAESAKPRKISVEGE